MPLRLLALLMALLLPVFSFADEYIPYEVYTFSSSLPAPLKEPLSGLISSESRVLSGAAIFYNGYNSDRPEPEYQTCYSAMMLVQSEQGLRLYAAAQPEGHPWEVNDYSHLLRESPNVSISIYRPQSTRVPQISIDYYTPGGLVSDVLCFWNNQLWCMKEYIDQGNGITVHNSMGMIDLTDAAGHESFRCNTPFFLDYMTAISDFPTCRAEAQDLSWLPDYTPASAGDIVYSCGANLRREPTTKSESLGIYAHNVPMVFTGEQKPGVSWPWYQVRIGDTIGWMSSNYVDDEPAWSYSPIPLGCTMNGCLLYGTPDNAQPIAQLQPGVVFHILTEYHDMYHICIPAEITWAADVNGLYGYIHKVDIIQGASISALEAQSAQ